ncbi:MAG: hypothetical protein ABI721_04640 [Candidatus Dojkabacteria bacterium]
MNVIEDETHQSNGTLGDMLTLKAAIDRARLKSELQIKIDAAMRPIRDEAFLSLKRISSSGSLENIQYDLSFLLTQHISNNFPDNILVGKIKSDGTPLAFFHLNELNILSVYELFGFINILKRTLQIAQQEDPFLKTYMFVIEGIAEEITDDLLDLLVMIRYIFPVQNEDFNQQDNKVIYRQYLKIFVKNDLDKVREIFDRTKISEIALVTDNSEEFYNACLSSIVDIAEA